MPRFTSMSEGQADQTYESVKRKTQPQREQAVDLEEQDSFFSLVTWD